MMVASCELFPPWGSGSEVLGDAELLMVPQLQPKTTKVSAVYKVILVTTLHQRLS